MTTNLKRADFVLVQHLQHAWHRALRERLDPHLSVDREERVFAVVCSCDPTPTGRYLSWLSRWRRRTWEQLGLRAFCGAEDLAALMAALRHFERIRKFLPREHGDVNRYHSAIELLNAEGFVEENERRAFRRAEKEVAIAGSNILFDDGHWKLVHLHSHAAAKWWGMGTRWCTSARSDSHYERYMRLGDLLVILAPNDRYQLSCGTGEFRNSADGHADLARVLRTAPFDLRAIVGARAGWRREGEL